MPWAYINRFVIFSVQWTLAWWCWWRHNSFLQDPGSGGQLAMKQCAIVNCLQIINNMPGYDQWLGCCASSNLILISPAQQLVVNWIFSIQTCFAHCLGAGSLLVSPWVCLVTENKFSTVLKHVVHVVRCSSHVKVAEVLHHLSHTGNIVFHSPILSLTLPPASIHLSQSINFKGWWFLFLRKVDLNIEYFIFYVCNIINIFLVFFTDWGFVTAIIFVCL